MVWKTTNPSIIGKDARGIKQGGNLEVKCEGQV